MAKQDVELKFSLIDGVSRGLAQIQQGVSGLGASLVKVNAAAELTGRAFGALGSIAGAFGDAVSGAASVEDALKRVSIITKATTEEQAALQQAVSDAVATTRFGAEEAAGALVLMAEDGFSASEAVKQLGTVLQFAQANAQSAATAAQALGAVLDTFGAPATQISALADALTATAVAAGTSTKALQEGLAGAGVAAEQAGLSINDTVAALGGLAQRGIEGGAAAKALNKILADSENPASKLGKALEAAGLAGKSFGEIVGILSNDASKAAPILASLGNKPAAALKALLTEGGGALAQFNEIINQSAGASAAAADSLNTTFLGALTRLQNQLVEARNEFLTPLLAPLAAEFEAFSAQILAFTTSDQFKALSEQFALFVSEGVGRLADELSKVDFAGLTKKIVDFAQVFAENISTLAKLADFLIGAVGTMYDTIKAGAAGIVEAFTGVASDIVGVAGLVSDSAAELSLSLRGMSTDARKLSDDALASLARRFGLTSTQATALAREVNGAAIAARVAAGDFKALESALPKSGIDQTIERMKKFGLTLKRDVPEAAAAATDGIDKVGESATRLKADFERAQIGTFIRAMDLLRNAGQGSSDTYKALSEQLTAAEGRLNELTQSSDTNKDAVDKQTEAVHRLREELQHLNGVQGDVVDSNRRVTSSNSQVSDSFGNVGKNSDAVAISLGNMTEAFVREATAAAASSTNARDYIATFNRYVATYEDQNKRIADRIAILDRQNASLSEEDKIRAQIEKRYGTSSTLVDVLIAKELALREAKKKTNDEAHRGLDIEKERANVAGAFGTGRPNADQGAATAAGKGAGDQGGGKGTTVVNNISVSAVLPTERSAVRSWVADVLVPELQNYQRLGR